MIEITGAAENNLKKLSLRIPKEQLVVLTGVSGSGKSSLAFDTIAQESSRQWQETLPLYLRSRMPHHKRPDVEAIQGLTPCVVVDQKPIGANARSTVGTASGIAPLLRMLFSRVGKPSPGGLDHRHRPWRRRPGRSGALYGNARPADSVPRLRNRPFSPENRRRTAPGLSRLPNPEYPRIGAHRYRCNLQKSSAASSPFRAKAGAFSQKNTLHADGMQGIQVLYYFGLTGPAPWSCAGTGSSAHAWDG